MSDYIEYKVRVYKDGTKEWRWYLNDELHREDGPAMEHANGANEWWLDGKRHREDGPAVEWANGDKDWYLNRKYYTEADYKAEMEKTNNTCEGKVITIEGKEYTLTEVKL